VKTPTVLTIEQAKAQYHSPMMTDAQMGESWLALSREMARSRWAKEHHLGTLEVGMAVDPRSGKAFFQWTGVLKYLNPAPPKEAA
jgi:hypothetical protein